MVAYLRFGGLQWFFPMSEGRTGFIIQSDLLENFNTTPVIGNASYFKDAAIWGHKELHLTRVQALYTATAANSVVFQWIVTGHDLSLIHI